MMALILYSDLPVLHPENTIRMPCDHRIMSDHYNRLAVLLVDLVQKNYYLSPSCIIMEKTKREGQQVCNTVRISRFSDTDA